MRLTLFAKHEVSSPYMRKPSKNSRMSCLSLNALKAAATVLVRIVMDFMWGRNLVSHFCDNPCDKRSI